MANFTPCPCFSDNALKGCKEQVRDFLPLMADYVDRQGAQEWKDWFTSMAEVLSGGLLLY
ncbi:MAG: hypothetical protein V8S34_02065 [Lawsonibacter sp.]